jgi:hypothetical protein
MAKRARLIGINHVAVEVGDVGQALALYGRLFEFEMRGRLAHMAFVDMGDQFIAISEPRSQPADDARHFGLVVDDVPAARAAVTREGLAIVGQSRRSFDFRVEGVKRKLGIEQLGKTDEARRQISERGID